MKKAALLVLLGFNAVSAVGGGIALMAGSINESAWIRHTGFTSLYFPGLILFSIVGGSAMVAWLAMWKKLTGWQIATLLSGIIMLFWITGEIVSIRSFHWLQIIYALSGLAVVVLCPKKAQTSV